MWNACIVWLPCVPFLEWPSANVAPDTLFSNLCWEMPEVGKSVPDTWTLNSWSISIPWDALWPITNWPPDVMRSLSDTVGVPVVAAELENKNCPSTIRKRCSSQRWLL